MAIAKLSSVGLQTAWNRREPKVSKISDGGGLYLVISPSPSSEFYIPNRRERHGRSPPGAAISGSRRLHGKTSR
jgi:hypothetical protein